MGRVEQFRIVGGVGKFGRDVPAAAMRAAIHSIDFSVFATEAVGLLLVLPAEIRLSSASTFHARNSQWQRVGHPWFHQMRTSVMKPQAALMPTAKKPA